MTDQHPIDIGYAPGAWDMFHVGHLAFLRRARRMCEQLVVGVVSDEALYKAKGKDPMFPLAERVAVVEALDIADRVVVDPSSDKRIIWGDVQFTQLFKGDDWIGTPQGKRLEDNMAKLGVRVHYLPYTSSTSSTQLRAQVVELTALPDPKFSIAFVCGDNRFRSPIAEALLRQRIDAYGLDWVVTSAGLEARPGQGLSPAAAGVLGGYGLSLPDFETQRFDVNVAASDLVLTLTDRQRNVVVRTFPRTAGHTYTLKQFAHLVRPVAQELNTTQHGLLRRAARGRALVQPLRSERDIPSPRVGDDASFADAIEQIEQALDAIITIRQVS